MMVDTWFGAEDAPTLGFLHVPDGGMARGGVVLCPPLGHEHVISYRALRHLGQQLAARGLAALRFDYLGEGDASGESVAPDAASRWLASIEGAVAYLRESGVERVALVGLTSGALLASEALSSIRDVSALVLWDPVLSGHRYLRRQRSLHELAVGSGSDAVEEHVRLLSLSIHQSTASWLEGREITASGLASAAVDTLVLTRHADADAPSVTRFVDALPANVEHEAILGQQDLMDVESAVAAIPFDTTALISDWLGRRFPDAREPVTPTVKSEARVGTSPDGVPIVERLGRFGPHRLFTIQTVLGGAEPSDELGVVVMQPAAAEHRVGPGRLQVHAARELAQRGYRAVRFDRRVTGDSTEVTPGEPSLVLAEEWVGDAQQLVAALRGSSPLALIGLCSGAWVAARIAGASDARLTILLDPNYFRTVPLAPGEYANRALLVQQGDPRPERLRGRLLRRLPGWLWRILSPAQIFEDPAVLLAPASRGRDSTVALLFTPEDEANFLRCRGADAVSWLRDRGDDIRVTSYPFGDHALFGEEVRIAVLRDVLALVQEAIPGLPATETSGLRA